MEKKNLKEVEEKKYDALEKQCKTLSQFWNYSQKNLQKIFSQMPNATKVAGYQAWKGLGRVVKEWSKPIKIFAPNFETEVEVDPNTGKETEKTVKNYLPVHVFDITQTESVEGLA